MAGLTPSGEDARYRLIQEARKRREEEDARQQRSSRPAPTTGNYSTRPAPQNQSQRSGYTRNETPEQFQQRMRAESAQRNQSQYEREQSFRNSQKHDPYRDVMPGPGGAPEWRRGRPYAGAEVADETLRTLDMVPGPQRVFTGPYSVASDIGQNRQPDPESLVNPLSTAQPVLNRLSQPFFEWLGGLLGRDDTPRRPVQGADAQAMGMDRLTRRGPAPGAGHNEPEALFYSEAERQLLDPKSKFSRINKAPLNEWGRAFEGILTKEESRRVQYAAYQRYGNRPVTREEMLQAVYDATPILSSMNERATNPRWDEIGQEYVERYTYGKPPRNEAGRRDFDIDMMNEENRGQRGYNRAGGPNVWPVVDQFRQTATSRGYMLNKIGDIPNDKYQLVRNGKVIWENPANQFDKRSATHAMYSDMVARGEDPTDARYYSGDKDSRVAAARRGSNFTEGDAAEEYRDYFPDSGEDFAIMSVNLMQPGTQRPGHAVGINPTGWAITDRYPDVQGQKSRVIMELQSDVHQAGSKTGYHAADATPEQIQAAIDAKRNELAQIQEYEIKQRFPPTIEDPAQMEEYKRVRARAAAVAKELSDLRAKPTDAFTHQQRDSWQRTTIANTIFQAVKAGDQRVSIIPGEVVSSRWGNQVGQQYSSAEKALVALAKEVGAPITKRRFHNKTGWNHGRRNDGPAGNDEYDDYISLRAEEWSANNGRSWDELSTGNRRDQNLYRQLIDQWSDDFQRQNYVGTRAPADMDGGYTDPIHDVEMLTIELGDPQVRERILKQGFKLYK